MQERITWDSLSEQERALLKAIRTTGAQQRIRKMLETGEGLIPEIKNSPKKEEILQVIGEMLQIMERGGIGA